MNTEVFNELINASREGDIDGLYTIIQKQPDILRQIDEKMLEHTPMHEAASTGQIRFTNEMMNLMPSFARKLNKEGQTPMQLALQNGHVELAFCLLNAEPDLVRVKGKNGMTTLHCAAEKGYYNLVANLLAICPNCIEDVNVDGETVVHIAVRERRSEVLEVVVGWLRRVWHEDASFWIESIGKQRNVQGHTALDIADSNADSSNEIKVRYKPRAPTDAHPSPSCMVEPNYTEAETQIHNHLLERLAVNILRRRMTVSDSLRDALLVVAGFLITASFQAAYTPPLNISKNGASFQPHLLWPIMKDKKKQQFVFYVIANSMILFAAICMIDFLLADVLCGPLVAVFLNYLLSSYTISIILMAPDRTAVAAFGNSMVIVSFLLSLMAIIFYFGRRKVLKANLCRKNVPHEEVKAVNEEVHGSNAISNESA